MSGVQFIRANPAVAGAESMTGILNRAEDRSRARGVDDAIRRGVMRGQKDRMAGGVTSADRENYAEADGEGIGGILPPGIGQGDQPAPTMLSDSTIPMARPDMEPAAYSGADGTVAGSEARTRAVGQPLYNPARPRATRDEDGNEWDPARPGQPWDAGLPPPTGRINPNIGEGVELLASTSPLRGAPAPTPPRDAPRAPDAPMAAGAREGAGGVTLASGGSSRRTSDFVLEELAQTPGGGAAALGIVREQGRRETVTARQDAQSRERAERLALQALGRGDITTFQHFAPQARINLPPEVVQNAEMRARIATAGLLAQRHYRGDAAGARRFVEAYVRSGDAAAALQQAGAPSTAGSTGFRPMWVQQDEQEILQFFNTRNPAAPAVPAVGPNNQPVTRPAQGGRLTTDQDGNRVIAGRDGVARPVTTEAGLPVRQPPNGAAAGRTMDRQLRLQMLIAGGVPEAEANMIAGGGVPSASARATIQQRLIVAAENNLDLQTAQQKADWVQRQMQAIFPPGAAPAAPAPSGSQPAPAGVGAVTPAPLPPAPIDPGSAAPPPAAAPGAIPPRPRGLPPGSQFSPSRQQWRDPNGNIYDLNGRPLGA